MRLMLDTHVVIWSQLCPDRLGKKCVKAIENTDSQLFVSAISMLEVGQLVEKKRLYLQMKPLDWFLLAVEGLGVSILSVTAEIAARAYTFSQPIHADPADRIIAATAFEEGLTLATADTRLLDFSLIQSMNAAK